MDSVHDDRSSSCRVPPFRDPRIAGYLLLPAAFRSLSRLSSALSAKASALRPYSLDLLQAPFGAWSISHLCSVTVRVSFSRGRAGLRDLVLDLSIFVTAFHVFPYRLGDDMDLDMQFSRYVCVSTSGAIYGNGSRKVRFPVSRERKS